MKLCMASHIVLDEIIDLEGKKTESLGGPVCYGSLLAKTFNFQSVPATRAGKDILESEMQLTKCNIRLNKSQVDPINPTTRFRLISKKMVVENYSYCLDAPRLQLMIFKIVTHLF